MGRVTGRLVLLIVRNEPLCNRPYSHSFAANYHSHPLLRLLAVRKSCFVMQAKEIFEMSCIIMANLYRKAEIILVHGDPSCRSVLTMPSGHLPCSFAEKGVDLVERLDRRLTRMGASAMSMVPMACLGSFTVFIGYAAKPGELVAVPLLQLEARLLKGPTSQDCMARLAVLQVAKHAHALLAMH